MADAGPVGRWRSLTRRDRRMVLVIPILLIAIATVSTIRFHTHRQSSWQGINFGMFATYDNTTSRFTRIEVVHGDETTRIDASGPFGDLVERGETTPLGPAPEELAEAVRERVGADRVVVEVWEIHIDDDEQLRLSIEPIRRTVAS